MNQVVTRKVGFWTTVGMALETIFNSLSAINNVAKAGETYTAVLPDMAEKHAKTVLAEMEAELSQVESSNDVNARTQNINS